MAEGDTVFATARRLNDSLGGRVILKTDFRVPRFATANLAGQAVREVASRGKHLLLRTDANVTVHSHLGMDGSWRLYEPGERWRGPSFEVRAVLETEPHIAVGHRLRTLEVLATAGEPRILGRLGPDPLGPDWDAAEATKRLTANPERAIGEAMLDQAVMAGPGNVYRSEVCFLAGVDPRTPVGDVPDPAEFVELVKSSMEANRAGGRRVTTGDSRRGHELWVYGRRGRSCRRCGTPIRSFTLGGDTQRIVFACPGCQPPTVPASEADTEQ